MRPLTAGQILDNTFRLFRENFATLFLLTLLLPGLIYVVYELLITYISNGFVRHIVSLLYSAVFYIVVYPLFSGLVTLCARRHMEGEKLTLKNLFRCGEPYMNKYMRTNLCLIVVVFGAVLLLSVISFFVFSVTGAMLSFDIGQLTGITIVMIIIMVLFAVAFSSLLLWLPLVYPVICYENVSGFKAVGRAITLGFHKFWRLWGVMILFCFLFMIILVGVMSVVLLLTGVFGAGLYIELWLENSFVDIGFSIVYQVFTPLVMIIYVWLYKDLRARLEGNDLVLVTETETASPAPLDNAYVTQ